MMQHHSKVKILVLIDGFLYCGGKGCEPVEMMASNLPDEKYGLER